MQANESKSPRMVKTRYPGIYKRGNRYVVVTTHRGRQSKAYFRTLAEAREAKGRRDSGDRAPETRQRFEDYAAEWIASYAGRTARGFTETSRVDYRRALDHYAIPYFRGWKLPEISAPDVRRFVRGLEDKGLAPASIVKNLVPLKALFATAVEDGALLRNPTTGVRVNGRREHEEEGEIEVKAMTRAELDRLLVEVPENWRLFFELLAHTGLRISEALGLDWTDVEFGARPRLHVRRQCYRGRLSRLKTRNSRRDLPLSPALARKLWTARPPRGDGPVFATRTGSRYGDRNVRRVLDAAAIRAGLTRDSVDRRGRPRVVSRVSFHTFRHTCASLLFERGKNILQVSRWLGHADEAFTLRTYLHLMDDGLGDAAFLDEVVAPWEGKAEAA